MSLVTTVGSIVGGIGSESFDKLKKIKALAGN